MATDTRVNLLGIFKETGLPMSTTISRNNAIGSNAPIVRLAVNERPKEHFMIDVGDEKNKVEVLNINKNFKQLVLLVKEPKRKYEVSEKDRDGNFKQISKYTDSTERRYLMGFDEKHLFISGLPKENIGTVAEAHQALKHKAVVDAEKEGKEIKRQGEYFFIPLDEKEEEDFFEKVDRDKKIKAKRDKLSRRGQRSHFVRRLIRMRRNRKVYAQGAVTHEQHNPLILSNWHMVYKNRETESPGISGFID